MDKESASDRQKDARRNIEDSLMFSREKIIITGSDPSSVSFVTWFMVSSYLPVFAACLGPIANMIGVAGIVDKWSSDENGLVDDPRGIFAVNVVSLVIGFVSNLILLLHFCKKVDYVHAQILNIIGWSLAWGILLIDVLVGDHRDRVHGFSRTIGFWYACITIALYAGCTITLCIHFVGYLRGHYPATFNLTDSERNVMIFTFILSLWFIWGSAMFSQLMGISYGNALYFCTISVLTIGLGDIVPTTVAGKIMVLIYSLFGLIILGLIVAMTRSVIQSSSGPLLFFYTVETARVKTHQRYLESNENYNNRDSFDLINKIRKVSLLRQQRWSILVILMVFVSFWLLGALVFHFAESWSYFNSIYFCFLCLITIGYGDFVPSTGCGRAFFVVWAIGAVPVMTAIISAVADTLFAMGEDVELSTAKIAGLLIRPFFFSYDYAMRHLFKFQRSKSTATDLEDTSRADDNSPYGIKSAANRNSRISRSTTPPPSDETNSAVGFSLNSTTDKTTHDTSIKLSTEENVLIKKLDALLGSVKWLEELSRKNEHTKISFDQWVKLYEVVQDEDDSMIDDPGFWLSEKSPLRYPLDEPRYVMFKLLTSIETNIADIIERLKERKVRDESAEDNQ